MNEYEELREKFSEIIAKKKFKIWYDKKINDLRAKGEFIQSISADSVTDIDIKPIGIDNINKLLRSFVEMKGLDLKYLVESKQISLDELARLGFEFDYVKGLLVEKRFTMADRIRLEEMKRKEREELVEKKTPIVAPKPEPIKDDEESIFESNDVYEIVSELKKLNPDVEFRVGIFGIDSQSSNRIYCSVPGDKLVLPKGFTYNDKNGITNKHLTSSGAYTTIEVKDISLLPKEEEWKFLPIGVDLTNMEEIKKALDEAHKGARAVPSEPVDTPITPEHVEETREDGARDAIVTSEKETKIKPKKGIKKLRTAGIVALTALAGGIIIVGGLNNAVKNNAPDTPDKSQVVVVDNSTGSSYQTTYNEPQEETIYVSYDEGNNVAVDYSGESRDNAAQYVNYGSVVEFDDMETQIQVINDTCFAYQSCSLHNLVIESDKEAIYTINNMRNRVLNRSCDAESYLNNIVNYIFENGSIFDGKVIKSYDSLSPYAQYIVLAASQSILQTCPNYDHTTTYNKYNYSILTNSFDYMVDEAYRYLTNNNKSK